MAEFWTVVLLAISLMLDVRYPSCVVQSTTPASFPPSVTLNGILA